MRCAAPPPAPPPPSLFSHAPTPRRASCGAGLFEDDELDMPKITRPSRAKVNFIFYRAVAANAAAAHAAVTVADDAAAANAATAAQALSLIHISEPTRPY